MTPQRLNLRARTGFLGGLLCACLLAAGGAVAGSGAVSRSGATLQVAPRVGRGSASAAIDSSTVATAAAVTHARRDVGALPLNEAAYWSAKAAAVRAPRQTKPAPGAVGSTANSPFTAPVTVTRNFNGIGEDCPGCLYPPDTNGSVGPTQYVEATNDHITVYNKAKSTTCPDPNPCAVKNTQLSAFFGAPSSDGLLFDPRVEFDTTWNRWVAIATRAASSSTDTLRTYYIAASKTSNAAGSWWLYRVGWTINNVTLGAWMDFPMLGMDQDALLISGNFFQTNANGSNSFFVAAANSIPKARVYNGWGFGFGFFQVGFSTHPPVVAGIPQLGDGPDYFAESDGSGLIHLWRMTDAAKSDVSVVSLPNVSIAAFGAPPSAGQPGTTVTLDTGDGRISSAPYQIGTSLFLTFDTNDFGFATPRFYQLNAATSSVLQATTFYDSTTSYDFNPSLAVNSNGDVFLTWSATDPTNSLNAMMLTGGRRATDTASTITFGSVLFTSPTFYTGGPIFNSAGQFTGVDRWGDYSGTAIDPKSVGSCSAGNRAWVTNEKVNVSTTWSTRAADIGFC